MITEQIVLRIGICLLGLFGFWVARKINTKKRSKNPFVCPIKFDCNSVVNSDYSKLFGVPIEIFGMMYYGLVFVIYLFSSINLYFTQVLPPNELVVFMIALSSFAFLFSLYLIGIQVFVIRKFCSWCLVSAAVSISIFYLTYLTYDFTTVAETIILK